MTLEAWLLTVGVATVGLAVATRLIRNLSLSSALLATCVGVVLGPRVAGVLVPPAHGGRHEVLLEAAEIALATSLMALARRFTPQQLRAATPRAARLVGFGMPGMALLTGAGAWLIFDVSFWPGMLIGASLAATDPVVAAALVSGRLAERNIPAWLRHVLELEAGSNDCLAVVLVLLPVAVLTHSEPVGPWLGDAAQEVGLAIGVGIASGALAALALRALRRAPGLDDDALRPVPLGLTIAVLALVDLLGGSGVLGVFAAGLTFSSLVTAEERHTTQQTQGAAEELTLIAVFVLFGASLPWSGWAALGWPAVAFAVWVLAVRRPPVVQLVLAGSRTPARAIGFLGWFGPLGVASIFYATHLEPYDLSDQPTIFAAITAAICASILAHTLTSTAGVQRYAGRPALETLRHPLQRPSDRSQGPPRRRTPSSGNAPGSSGG